MLPFFSLAGSARRLAGVGTLFFAGLALAQDARLPVPAGPIAAASAELMDVGPLDSSERLSLTLTLAVPAERAAALTQFLAEVQRPGSASYRRWVTAAEFRERYGAPAEEVAAAAAWAQAQGLTVETGAGGVATSGTGTRMTVSGSASQWQSALAISLHSYQTGSASYFASPDRPSLPAAAAELFRAIDGLDNLPDSAVTVGGAATTFAGLAAEVDANTTPVLTLDTGVCADAVSAGQVAEYTALFAQAAAQGMTVLSTSSCAGGGFPGALSEVTAVALPGGAAESAGELVARPVWQVAPGLPANGFRQEPDLTAESAAALASTLTQIAGEGQRLGAIDGILYELGPVAGLYRQADGVAAGTWEPATGLGLVDLDELLKVFPRGTGSSFVSLAASSYAPTYGTAITFTSSVSSGTGGVVPTGTVSYVAGTGTGAGTVLGSAAVDASGNATFTTAPTQLAGGTYSATAQYSGDGTYAAATSSPAATIVVKPASATLTGTVSASNTVGGVYTITLTATGMAGQPGGEVTLSISGTSTSYTQALMPLGANTAAAMFVEPATTVGTLTVAGNCAGNGSFSCPNPWTGNLTIAKATPALNISYTPNPPVSGGTIDLSATLGAAGTAPLPTGTVTFYDNATGLNAASIDTNGMAATTGVVPTTASHSIMGVYNGDANYNTVSVTGATTGKVATSTALSASAYAVAAGQSVTLTATVSNGSATGTVTFSAAAAGGAAVVLAANVPVVGRVATFTSTTLAAGSYTLTAVYSGDANNAGSTGTAPDPLVVGAAMSPAGLIATTTTLAVSPAPPVAGVATELTATVAAASAGASALAGTVTFYNGTAVVGSGTVASGMATASVTFASATSLSLTAVYSGDAVYATSTSAPVTSQVGTVMSSVVLTASPLTGLAGGNVSLSAAVTGAAGASSVPTGSVGFYVSGTTPKLLGSAALVAAGSGGATASLNTSAIPAGAQSVYAAYAGDSVFAASTSAAVALGLSDYAVTMDPGSLTIAAGGSGTEVLALTSASGFSGTVAVSCIPPAGAAMTCSLSQSSLMGAGTSTVTISTGGTARVEPDRAPDGVPGRVVGGVSVVGLLCLLLPVGRRRRRVPRILLVLLTVGLMMNLGCGTQGTTASAPSSPKGTFAVAIDTASGSINHDYVFQVTVQ